MRGGGPPVCIDDTLDLPLPISFLANTNGSGNDSAGSCGGGPGPDEALWFTAPTSAWYEFSLNSGYDNVIYLRDDCEGNELRCENDIDGNGIEELHAWLESGESVVAIVDSDDKSGGVYEVDVTVEPCAQGTFPDTVPATVFGTNGPGSPNNSFVTHCGTQRSLLLGYTTVDTGWGFTAPSTGMFVFDNEGSEIQHDMMSMWHGLECNNPHMIQCRSAIPNLSYSQLFHWFEEGEQVTLIMDSTAISPGDYQINVSALEGDCPDFDLGNEIPARALGTTVGSDNTMIGRLCDNGGYQPGDHEADDIYSFTAPVAGRYAIHTVGSELDTAVYVLDGAGCGGEQLECGRLDGLLVDLEADQDITIVVDGETDGEEGAYQLHADVLQGDCAEHDLGSEVPQRVRGDTTTSDNTTEGQTGSSSLLCQGGFSGDDSYVFTAPSDGVFTFSTLGADFDTVVYAYEGVGCGGEFIECANDYGSTDQSILDVALTEGQTITVVVDGHLGAEGRYILTVEEKQCPDEDLGSTVPVAVSGSTFGEANVIVPSACNPFSNAGEYVYAFTAPADGDYTITVDGDFDRTLTILDGTACDGPLLGCDVAQIPDPAEVVIPLTEGQEINIQIDGSFNDVGDYDLTITN